MAYNKGGNVPNLAYEQLPYDDYLVSKYVAGIRNK